MLVTIGSYTPASLVDTPASKTLSEDVTQAELVASQPSPVPTNEEPVEESSTNDQLGESYVADVQHYSRYILFHWTNAEACKDLTNHFNQHWSDKVYNTFKDLFNNIYVDSIQETYPQIGVYNKKIVSFLEETNLKYGLDLKYAKLNASEVGLWAKAFQAEGHSETNNHPVN